MRNQRWMPPGVHLPQHQLDLETVAAIIRITGGNFRLDTRRCFRMARNPGLNRPPGQSSVR